MKCILAEWEQRNLGCRTIELTIEKSDTLLSMEEILQNLESQRREYQAQYSVIKVDTKYQHISQELQKNGHILIESQIGLKLDRESASEAYEKYKDLFPDVTYNAVDHAGVEFILSEIEKGIFSTDRIALDPHFGIKIANQRYALWIQDELKRGAKIFLSYYKNQPIGFFLSRDCGKGYIKGLLGGLFTRKYTHNYGSLYIFSTLKSFLDGNGKIDRTTVSSNNVPILQLHLMFGRRITNISNVFVMHY